MQPKIYISYSPGKNSVVSTLFYVESHEDIYGWYSAAESAQFSAAFFMIENFYADRTALLYRSVQDDVHGDWVTDSPPAQNEIRCPLPEPVRHELERIQSKFIQEWLFFGNDPDASSDFNAYRDQGLPVQAVNIKPRKLNRLHREGPALGHYTAGIDLNVLDFLQKHWRESTPADVRSM